MLTEQVDFVLEKEEILDVKWIKMNEINLQEIGFLSLRKAVEHYISRNK